MPTTRRSTAAARGRTGPTKGQSTISFSNKVTKPTPHDAKKVLDLPAVAKAEIPERPSRATKAEAVVAEDSSPAAVEERESVQEPALTSVDISREEVPDRSEAEIEADKVTDAQINSYWAAVEKKRKAPMVHLEGIDVSEKALRHFDVSSQYGPCIGVSRAKRWQRAQRLGLEPPIEILAILQREEKKGHQNAETAHMDRILNATALAT